MIDNYICFSSAINWSRIHKGAKRSLFCANWNTSKFLKNRCLLQPLLLFIILHRISFRSMYMQWASSKQSLSLQEEIDLLESLQATCHIRPAFIIISVCVTILPDPLLVARLLIFLSKAFRRPLNLNGHGMIICMAERTSSRSSSPSKHRRDLLV